MKSTTRTIFSSELMLCESEMYTAVYDSGCNVFCTGPDSQINMKPHPVTLYWHRANQPCSSP